MKKIKVSLAQIPEQSDLWEIKEIIREKKHSDIIIFPEATLFIDNLKVVSELQKIVKDFSVSIVIGIVVKKDKKLYNYAYYISSSKIERYRKVHIHWTEKYIPGNRFKVINTRHGKIGLLICFDSSFSETGRILALKGAEIIIILHAIPKDFSYKINLIRSQAMALNNQVFVVDCCKPGRQFTGHGAIFDPYGNELTQLKKFKSIVTRNLNLEKIKEWRKKEKIFQNRKPKLYRKICKKI